MCKKTHNQMATAQPSMEMLPKREQREFMKVNGVLLHFV